MQTVFDRDVDPALIARALGSAAFGSMWLDSSLVARPDYPRLSGDMTCDLLVVGGGYAGLWSALHAKARNPGARVVLIEAERVGWAASGRNGGFVEASITHGAENGKSRWPTEFDRLEKLGLANLDGMQADIASYGMNVDWERTGMLTVATEPHQVEWLAEGADDGEGRFLDQAAVRAEVASPTYQAGLWATDTCAIVHPARLVFELARACSEAGVEVFEHTAATSVQREQRGIRVETSAGVLQADQVVLATNVFPSLLKRNRFHTIPVYDYVLSTEPLSSDQLERIGWRHRQGIGDSANQFHYYRLSADNRIVWGGYDAVYHYGRRVDSMYEDRPESYRKLAAHFFITFPQLEDVRFSHRWAGAIDTNTRFCAHWGLAGRGRIAYVNGFTGLGVGAARFAADVCLDLLDGHPTERTELEMVNRKPLPFPPEPVASVGIQATRWSLDRADHNQGKRNLILRTLDRLGLGFDS
ncbi:NAD(P)/FAD-dependent oxidoreductase [Mycolicibacterium aichiense]|uniref:NAD(P)/FAD-dependent oxidoreductase n=1 Tax=Mycolicibacterium aichiense TaxID=1799 RepID=UPI003D67318E